MKVHLSKCAVTMAIAITVVVSLSGCDKLPFLKKEEAVVQPTAQQLAQQSNPSVPSIPDSSELDFELSLEEVVMPEDAVMPEEQVSEEVSLEDSWNDVLQSIVDETVDAGIEPELPEVPSAPIRENTEEESDVFVEPTEDNKFPNTGIYTEDD